VGRTEQATLLIYTTPAERLTESAKRCRERLRGKAAKRRAAHALIQAAGTEEAARLRKQGHQKAAQAVLERTQADAALVRKVTQHWFRHLLATKLLRRDPRAAMEQGGWLDIRSVMGYSHDVPEYRRKLVMQADDMDANWTRAQAKK
jgi:site-specific recombinase XerD